MLFGAAFYDEYRRTGSLAQDLDLMVGAGFTVIRVGESVWSTWEPSPGEFSLDWLAPVLDGAYERGLSVVLGTPTYAVPAWLSTMHPEIAADLATGTPHPWGSRQEVDITHPTFRWYAERVVREVVARYAGHPAVIGFQVDNEPGLHLLHNEHLFERFRDHLLATYGDVETLNERWGLTYWSHRLRDLDELWRPDGNHSPQYQLEWRRFQHLLVDEFIAWQADIVREYAGEDQFVTTCISYERPAVDDRSLTEALDVTAGNPYYKMQDALDITREVRREEMWWSSGVWGLYEQADRMWSSKQDRFLVTETNAQSIGQSHWQNHIPYPGQIELAGLALVARGAAMIEYWQWQTLHVGIETYWGGVLPHSGRPGRIYREVSRLGHRLRELSPQLEGFVPDADVTLVYSTDTKRSFDFYPPLADADGGPDRDSYLRIFDAFYRGAFEAGAQARVLHVEQLTALTPADAVRQHPVLVVPSLYVASDAQLDALVAYAEAGGHLVVGIRTGYGDELARARPEVAPARIGPAAGVMYDEYTTLDSPAAVTSSTVPLGDGAAGDAWADGLHVEGAEVLVCYTDGIYAGGPAVTTREVGLGRMTYVGTVPNRTLAADLLRWAVPRTATADWTRDPAVTVTSGRSTHGRLWFVSNWSRDEAEVLVPVGVGDGDGSLTPGSRIRLAPWSVRVLLAQATPAQEVPRDHAVSR
ncbi:beta-galactosidase [Phycicoccus sp. CMS6Z-2]|nr:beta-galactosidase [Phycicoccus flavus]